MLYQRENFGNENYHDIRQYDNINFTGHLHRSAELVSVLEGELILSLQSRHEKISAGECALIMPDKIHSYETPISSKSIVHVFSSDNTGAFFSNVRGTEGETARFTPTNEVFDFYVDTVVRRRDYGRYALKGCLYLMLDAYCGQTIFVPNGTKKNSSIIESMFSYISEHFRERITLSDLETTCGYSAHYLSRVFSDAVGINFKRFVNELRLEYARELLNNTTLSVTEIAYKSGFGSIRSFNRAFGEEYHSAPRQSRTSIQNNGGGSVVLYLGSADA